MNTLSYQWRAEDAARELRFVQTGNLQTYAFLFVLGTGLVLDWARSR